MTTKKQIKALTAPLLDRNPDLVIAGRNSFWLLPIGNVGRLVLIDRRSSPDYCVASWHLVEFFMPEVRSWSYLGRCNDEISRSKGFAGGAAWFWSDPTIYEDFVTRVEADALAILRPLDTTGKCLDFARTRPASAGYLSSQWHLVTAVALGKLEDAQGLWATMARYYRKGTVTEEPSWQRMYDRFCLIGEPLMDGDRACLAALLHRWAAEAIVGSPLEPYWTPTPFPLEDDA